MRRRNRFIAGLVTLVALTLSLAEGTWASTCMPDMEMGASSTADSHGAAPGHDGMAGHPGNGDGDGRPAAPYCPFGPMGVAQSCAVAASLPASSAAQLAPSPERAILPTSSETTPHILLGTALFHPPRL